LALFLDDLQWLDAATLDLLEDLLTRPDVQHLILIGAYRDNEADSTHPLVRKLEAIRQSGATVHEIILAPLAREDLGRLIADALHCEPERVTPLAQLVQEKTAGNPFFVIQFIRALVEEAFLTFEHGGGGWSWDLSRIHDKGYTDNVVDLMIGKVNRLPVETQKALQEFACLGNSAEIKTLSAVCATSEEELHSNLWEAVRLEYIRRSEDSYIFGHDRVQEAAYSLIPEKLRAEAHVRIGRILRVHTPADKLEERIFEIVNQFNRGTALIVTQGEREQVAELNLVAGKRAKSATAYASALRYLTAGRTLLGENAWEECNQLTFQLELNHAECEYLTGKLALAEEHLSALSTRAQSIFESAAVSCMRINLYTTLDRSDSAVEVGLDYLRRVDEGWPTHPTADHVQQEYSRLWLELGSRPIEAMLDLPLMSDAEKSATMDVLTVLTIPALFTDLNLCRLIVGRMATLSLEHGNCDGSCLAYEWLGGVLGTYFGKYEAGFRFGRLGLELVEKHGLDRFKARVYVVFAVHVAHWTQPLQISRDVLRRGFLAARDAGDLSYATYSCIDLITNRFAAGDPLSEVEREAEDGLEFARKACFGLAIDCITGQLRLIRMLRGRTPDFTSFNDAEFDEERFAQHLENNPQLAIGACYYWVRKLQACVYAGDGASGIVAASKVASLLWTAPAQFEHAEYHFYGALARAAHCDKVLVEERSQHLEALAAQHKLLTIWAENCPENFENRAALVGAEIARIQGRELDAERLYEQAIRSSNANGFVQNEALANELAARFYMARGFEKIAYAYLRDARHNYVRWGAAGKVRHLDELYPQFKADEQAAAPTSTIRTPIEHLDLATVIKVSQAVSREVVSEKLIDTIMRTAIQYAGASRGLLIVPLGDQRRIEAEAATTGDTVIVRVPETLGADAAVPDTIVHYVARTHESLILDDASADNPFSADPYFREQPARSILCLPLINQAKLIAVLYLENNLAPRIFTPARITVLKLLAAQAAISLENTLLYGALEEREAALRRSETYLSEAQRLSQTGSFGWDVESGEIYWSQETFRIFEYDPTTEPGLELILHRTHPADRSIVRELIDRVSAERKDFDFEHRLLVPDGSVKYLRVVGHPSTREKSGRFEFVGAVMDITEQKRAEEELRRSQAYLAEAESLSKSGSWALKPATKEITYWSPERYHLFGFDPDAGEPSYEAVLQRIHPEDRTRWLESTEDAVRERRDSDLEFRVVLPHGEIKHLYGVGHPVFSETGELVEVIGAAIDITERKRVERELHQKEVSLREAQSSLAHVSRVTTMGELAASIAHEVNQPLVGVVANAGAGLRYLGWDTPNLVEAKEAIRRIIRDGNRAAEVVSRMRALFKKTHPVKEALNINEAIEEVVLLTQGEARRNKVKLRVEPYTNLALVMADRVQVQQVLMNLILNGIQAMSEVQDRERVLVVSAQSGEGDEIRVAVQDCGIGIDPGDMERIFDAFHTTKPGGMGMGLSISRSIVESHGGRLWATPNDGLGVTFQFTL
jgi:PAS domain S-box-containing protein